MEDRLGDRGDARTLFEVEEDHHAPLPLIGAQLDPDPDPREPANLRTIGLPLRPACAMRREGDTLSPSPEGITCVGRNRRECPTNR
jgi:hypothetical protein